MTTQQPDTEELLRLAEHGESGAREGLLARNRDRLRKMIAWRLDRRLVARVDPSDVVQEVLLEASGKMDESAAELASRLVTSSTSPTQRALRQELRERVQQALGQLKERDREVLVLRNLEQLSVADTAEVLGISASAVKVRHMRALERLYALLAEEDEEEMP
jgi:RNA polymerase sigma-70 factor (ECF subfamily)